MRQAEEQGTIHCPGCGAPAPLKQKFCRSCGFSLEKITQVVAEQLSSQELLSEKDRLQKRQKKIDRSLVVAGIGFVALLALSALTGLIYLIAVGNMPIVPGFILLILMLVGIVAGSLATYSERLRRTLANRESVGTKALAQGESSPELEGYDGRVISVTERTTNLLEANLKTSSPPRKEDGA